MAALSDPVPPPSDNPYASPLSPAEFAFRPQATAEEGPWRMGKFLVLRRDAGLVDRCLECGEPTAGSGYVARFKWAPWFLAWRYARARVSIPVCQRHRWRYRWSQPIEIGTLLSVLLGSSLLLSSVFGTELIVVWFNTSYLGGFASGRLIRSMILGPQIIPAEIDPVFVCLKNVPAPFLAGLPQFDGHLAHPLRYSIMYVDESEAA